VKWELKYIVGFKDIITSLYGVVAQASEIANSSSVKS
jgi:hypothetical protein